MIFAPCDRQAQGQITTSSLSTPSHTLNLKAKPWESTSQTSGLPINESDKNLASTVATVANQLKISQQAVISHVIADYVKKIMQHQQLLAFAGILEESEADELLEIIQ
jgi:hypothetical protein